MYREPEMTNKVPLVVNSARIADERCAMAVEQEIYAVRMNAT
jgi:hypothetical protein